MKYVYRLLIYAWHIFMLASTVTTNSAYVIIYHHQIDKFSKMRWILHLHNRIIVDILKKMFYHHGYLILVYIFENILQTYHINCSNWNLKSDENAIFKWQLKTVLGNNKKSQFGVDWYSVNKIEIIFLEVRVSHLVVLMVIDAWMWCTI